MEKNGGSIGTILRKTGLGLPVLCAFLLFLIMLCISSPRLYHADNITFTNALYLNEDASPHWIYPSYLLSYPICWFSRMVPQINAYLVYLYALLVCSATAVLRATTSKGGFLSPFGLAGMAAACYIIFWLPMHMEYAWISFAAAGCGCMLVFHALYKEDMRLRHLLPGAVLFLAGALLRHDSCIGFLPFIGMASLFLLRREKTSKGLVMHNMRRLFVPACAVAVLLILPFIQHIPAKGIHFGEGDLIEESCARMAFCDYPDRSGMDKTEAYMAEGIPPECVQLVEGYFYEDSEVMTPGWWKAMADVRRLDNHSYISGMKLVRYTGQVCMNWRFLLLTMVLLTVWGVLAREGTWRLYPLALLFAYLVGVLACCAKSRCHDTPMMTLTYFHVAMQLIPCGAATITSKQIRYSVVFGAVVAVILVCATMVGGYLGGGGFSISRLAYLLIPLSLSCGVAINKHIPAWRKPLIILLFALAGIAVASTHAERLQAFGGFRHTYAVPAGRSALEAWAQTHPDQIFMMDCYAYRDLVYPDTALIAPRTPYLPNVMELGNWPSQLPYREANRKKLGIDNEVFSLLAPSARVVMKTGFESRIHHLLRYLRAHYHIDVSLEKEYALTDSYIVYRPVIQRTQ